MTSASATFTESEVEDAALEWLDGLGWNVAYGPSIAPDTADSERAEYTEVVLEQRARDALGRLNPALPIDSLDDAFRKLTQPEGSTLEARKPRVPPHAGGRSDGRVSNRRGCVARSTGLRA